jgi:iron complex outermembrane receptor protein
VEIGGGSYGTLRGAAAVDVGGTGRLSVDGARERFEDDDAGVDRGHARYRLRLPREIRLDADAAVLKQDPTSPHPRKGSELDPAIPQDANHNPKDARLDTTRLQLSASQATRLVDWTAAVSHVEDDNVRGFLEEDAADDGSTPNANGYTQDRDLTELYGLAHHRFVPDTKVGVTVGGDLLFGEGKESSRNFRYYAPLQGGPRQSSGDGVPVEDTEFEAERWFLGLFTEVDWHPAPAWTVLAGARFNSVEETREGETEENGVETPKTVKDNEERFGGRVGVTWQAWRSGADALALYVDARDTFKPAAIDFGPEAEVDPLEPETARNVEVGVRADLAQRRLHLDASAFRMDFENLVVATIVDGRPALENAGTERFDGVELDAECEITPAWRGVVTYAWHDAAFLDYEQDFGGTLTRLDGNRLEMSPQHLASAGLAYAGGRYHAEALASYVGERYLNKRNTALADAYTTLDASAGFRVGRMDLRVSARNLTDRRDPVAESELGDAQYYRLPARAVEGSASIRL